MKTSKEVTKCGFTVGFSGSYFFFSRQKFICWADWSTDCNSVIVFWPNDHRSYIKIKPVGFQTSWLSIPEALGNWSLTHQNWRPFRTQNNPTQNYNKKKIDYSIRKKFWSEMKNFIFSKHLINLVFTIAEVFWSGNDFGIHFMLQRFYLAFDSVFPLVDWLISHIELPNWSDLLAYVLVVGHSF